MLFIALALIAGTVGFVVYTLLSDAEEKAVVRSSLRQLEGYEVQDVRDQELLIPLYQRALLPVLRGLTALGGRFTPVGYVDQVRKKFIYAGRISADGVDRFLAIRVITVVAIPVWFVIVTAFFPFTGILRLGALGLGGMVLALGPDSVLNRRVEERQVTMQRKLPDILDLLTISVEAGLGFEQAVDRTVGSVPGPLSDEFARMLGELRAGSSRADAMRALDTRTNVPEIRSFVLAILQADAFGVSIGRVLRAQADEMRIKRRQLAQEKAQKAPVKMLIPMVFCIFPALFVVVIGPAMINISRNF
jgi:tight adherence protein C